MRSALLQTASAALCTLALAAIVHAQTAKPAQPAKPDPTLTTIVGCLVHENPANPKGSSTPSANDYFVRTPTVALPVGATVAVGKPGTTSTATSAGKPAPDSYYRITGMTREQLQPHVGHKVEFQGHLSAGKPNAAAGGVNKATTTVDAAGKPKVTVETRVDVAGDLHATTIKMVSATCP